MIALIDRLASYAARESENEDPEEKRKQEEEAAKRLAERVKGARARGKDTEETEKAVPQEAGEWAGGESADPVKNGGSAANGDEEKKDKADDGGNEKVEETQDTEEEKKKFRGIPDDVKLFEVFWHQVVELIKVSPDEHRGKSS